MLLGAAFAIATGVVWAISVVSIRKGLNESNYLTVTLIVTFIGNAFFWPLTLLVVKSPFNTFGALFFILTGFLNPGLIRPLYFKGLEEVGISVNASIVAMYPMFSTLLAILLLGERPTFWTLAGMVCIIFGSVLVQGGMHGGGPKVRWTKLLFPFSTAVVSGISYIGNKVGLTFYSEPVAGVSLGYLSALLLYTLLLTTSSTLRGYASIDRRAFKSFWKGGIGICLGLLLSFYALWYGEVSIVVPLIQSEPLFLFLFTFFYLKGIETVSTRIIAGALSIILGDILITLL